MSKTLMSAIEVADRAVQARALRAVDYLRVSTEEQAKGYGITYSGKRTARYIAKKGWEHVGTYADEGLSGSLEAHERNDLKRLMADIRKSPRPFDMVVVNEGRVIGRTGRAFWRWVWDLEDIGVYVAVVDGDFDNSTDEGRARMRDAASYAEKERELIRKRTQGGIQEAAEEGLYPGGGIPFGWTVKKGHFVVAKKAAKTLRRGREVFLATRSWRSVALTWNSEGMLTVTGKQWTRKNARRAMLSEATLNNRIIWRGQNAARRADGNLIYGERVVIKLPKIFSKKEVKELRAAAERAPRPIGPGRVYLLTGVMTSPCGQTYRGHNHRPGAYSYQCKGREEKYAGAGGTCVCPPLDVEPTEEGVWRDAMAVLGDAERMKAMAKDWINAASADHVDHVGRIARLDQQIAEQSQVIDVTMPVAARQAAKRGLSGVEAEAAVEAAIRPLAKDLVDLEQQRAVAAAWQREAEEATRRARDFERLAKAAKANLVDLSPESRAELFDALGLQAEVVRSVPKKLGVACRVTDWFVSRSRHVPTLTDEGWERVRPLLAGVRRDAGDRRPTLEALLEKARTGARFKDLPERYGNPASIQTQTNRWIASGAWDAAMELLADMPGVPAWTQDPVEIRVSLRPLGIESYIGTEDEDGWIVSQRSALRLTFMTAA